MEQLYFHKWQWAYSMHPICALPVRYFGCCDGGVVVPSTRSNLSQRAERLLYDIYQLEGWRKQWSGRPCGSPMWTLNRIDGAFIRIPSPDNYPRIGCISVTWDWGTVKLGDSLSSSYTYFLIVSKVLNSNSLKLTLVPASFHQVSTKSIFWSAVKAQIY